MRWMSCQFKRLSWILFANETSTQFEMWDYNVFSWPNPQNFFWHIHGFIWIFKVLESILYRTYWIKLVSNSSITTKFKITNLTFNFYSEYHFHSKVSIDHFPWYFTRTWFGCVIFYSIVNKIIIMIY